MSYTDLMYIHLATVVPCVFLGLAVFIMRKGTPLHKLLGRIYMVLMIITAFVTLFMPAHVGARFLNHFGWIHSFSLITFLTIPRALYAIRRGNVGSHKRAMVLLYVGAIGIAGGFTLVPGRYLHTLFFG